MRVEQFKILNAARTMRDFTTRELADRAGVHLETAKTVLRRQSALFERTGEQRGRPRPGVVFKLNPQARQKLLELVAADREAALATPADPAEAASAFAQDHNQFRVRTHLSEARTNAADAAARAAHIDQARRWMRQELVRVKQWSAVSRPPVDLENTLKLLQRQVAAVGMGVDLLDTNEQTFRVDTAARWIANGIEAMVLSEGRPNANPFAPLDFTQFHAAPLDPDRLVEALAIAVRSSGDACSLPSERLAAAALAALPLLGRRDLGQRRWRGRTALQVGQDLVHRVGPDFVGKSLFDVLDAYSSCADWVRDFVSLIIAAIYLTPRLIYKEDERTEAMRMWIQSLRGRNWYSDDHCELFIAVSRYCSEWTVEGAIKVAQPIPQRTERDEHRIASLVEAIPVAEDMIRYAKRQLGAFFREPVAA